MESHRKLEENVWERGVLSLVRNEKNVESNVSYQKNYGSHLLNGMGRLDEAKAI